MLTLGQHRVYRFIQHIFTAPTCANTAEIASGIGIQSRGVVHRC